MCLLTAKMSHENIASLDNCHSKANNPDEEEESLPCLPHGDNKMMVNVALPERPPPQTTVVNIPARGAPQPEQGKKKSSCRIPRLRPYVAVDFLIFIVATGVMLIIELGYIPSTKLGFTCRDPTISYPYRGDTISPTVILVGSFLGPLLLTFLLELFREKSIRKVCMGTVWYYYKECLIGASLILLITQIMKVLVGEHRPHFFDTCEPDANLKCRPGDFILDYNCTNSRNTAAFWADASRSFPSGHTSISMFAALYCSYLVQVRISTDSVTYLTKPFLIATCLTWTCVCSLSRITDRRHHWWDVLAGAVLGVCGALYTIILVHRKNRSRIAATQRINTSTMALLDVKNKDATSVNI